MKLQRPAPQHSIISRDPRKILIIKPSSLGDVIHGLPVLHALKARSPGAMIDWVVARGFHEILEAHPLINRLWVIDKNSWKRLSNLSNTFHELKKLREGLRRERYDLVIDLQGLFRSAMIGLFAEAAERVGFESAREGAKYAYTRRVAVEPEIHAVEKNLRIAELVGCEVGEAVFPLPPLGEVPEEVRRLPHYAVIAPSAGTLVKRWPVERFADLASRLPIPSVVVGSRADTSLGDEIARLSNGAALSLAGKTSLKQVAAIIQRARFLVCPDTGPMHIAAALNVPVFAIFGPTSPARTGPYGSIHTVIRAELPCSPCYTRKPCADWACMRDITSEAVLRTVMDKWDRGLP